MIVVESVVEVGLLIYFGLFLILSFVGMFRNESNLGDATGTNSFIKQLGSGMKNLLVSIYLPLLIPIKLLGDLATTILKIVDKYTTTFVQNLMRILLFPLTILNLVGEYFSQEKISKRIENIEKNYKSFFERKSVKEKLKIYNIYVKRIVDIEGSFLQDYYAEQRYKFLALLLQIVSFFTTYVGVEIFFGDLFDLAPLFITLVIQIGLYTSAMSINKMRKIRIRRVVLNVILLLTSICFSYIGLITLACPPEYDYEKAYNTYKVYYDLAHKNISDKLIKKDEAKEELDRKLSIVGDTLTYLDKAINQKKEAINNDSGKVTRETTTRIDEYGNQVIVTTQTQEVSERRTILENELDRLMNNKENLIRAWNSYAVNSGAIEDKQELDYQKIVNEYLSANIPENINEMTKEDDNRILNLIKTNNAVVGDSSEVAMYYIEDIFYENFKAKYKDSEGLEVLKLDDWNTLISGVDSDKNDLLIYDGEMGIPKKIVITLGNLLGADLRNSETKNLLEIQRKSQEVIKDNYEQISLYKRYLDSSTLDGENNIFELLGQSKDEVMSMPNVFFIGFSRFADKGVYQNSAIICLMLAVFTDGITCLLGYVAARKSYSFLYVKSSKDYYNDVDELFGVIFKSMMKEFTLDIRNGKYDGEDKDEFIKTCIQHIETTAKKIDDFLNKFSLSEATSQIGYNLKWRYNAEDDIKEFIPMISVLIKTNMLKVIPVSQYKHLELEYYCGINLPIWEQNFEKIELNDDAYEQYINQLEIVKKEGHILLLRNRAENYLREHMCVTKEREEDGDDVHN